VAVAAARVNERTIAARSIPTVVHSAAMTESNSRAVALRTGNASLASSAHRVVEPFMVTTTFALPGYRTARSLGVARGIVVRSRSIIGNFAASIQILMGGNITMFAELCERARGDAFELMLKHAAELGANAVVGMRYDANEIAAGVTEVLCYGTAVLTEAE